MNSSTVIKRTLPLLLVILLIIGIAISCTVFTKDKEVPLIDNENGAYLSITEGDRTYSITNKEMYDQLKTSVGLSVLLDKIDTDLLKSKNYYDEVTETDIDNAIKEAATKDKDTDLDADETAKAITEYKEGLYTSAGLRTEEDIRDYHRLILAKKAYAKGQLDAAIQTANENAAENNDLDPYFTDDEIDTYYRANYKSGYWTIIVPFKNKVEGENILKQLGITIQKANPNVTNDFDKWVKTVDGQPLTPTEIAKAFIDMYNTVNSYKVTGYPSDRLTLVEGTQYYLNNEGKITFKTNIATENEDSPLNELYYTYDEITKYQAEIQNFLRVSMSSYDPSVTTLPSTRSWFTANLQSYNNNGLFAYILKITEQSAPSKENVKDEITNKLTEKELTDEYITKQIINLRTEKGLKFYDPLIEENYIKNVSTYDVDYKKSKKGNVKVVASVVGLEYTADQLFTLMDGRYGISIAVNKINFQRLLNNPTFNKIYNYYEKDLTNNERILDKDKWEKVRNSAVLEKRYFASGAYSQYGFNPTYGWKNFLRDFYNVSDAEELLYYFLYTDVMNEYSKGLSDVSEVDEESTLWKLYVEKMNEVADKYFNVTGIHLLISVNDEAGNPIKPAEWTSLQEQYAKELYAQVWKFYETETGTSSEKLQRIATLFNEAPRFLADREQTVTAQPTIEGAKYVYEDENNYRLEFAKYKSAGLSVKFEDLGSFTNGQMVEPFDEAVRSIWKANPTSTSHTPYGHVLGSNEYDYLVTEFGYHVYINTSSTDIPKWYYSSDTNKTKSILPTLQMVKTYLKDSASEYLLDEEGNVTTEAFTTEMKNAVTTYFTPIKDEIAGSYYTSIELFNQLKDIEITFNLGNFTRNDFNKFIDLRIESYQSNLKYFKVEE